MKLLNGEWVIGEDDYSIVPPENIQVEGIKLKNRARVSLSLIRKSVKIDGRPYDNYRVIVWLSYSKRNKIPLVFDDLLGQNEFEEPQFVLKGRKLAEQGHYELEWAYAIVLSRMVTMRLSKIDEDLYCSIHFPPKSIRQLKINFKDVERFFDIRPKLTIVKEDDLETVGQLAPVY